MKFLGLVILAVYAAYVAYEVAEEFRARDLAKGVCDTLDKLERNKI